MPAFLHYLVRDFRWHIASHNVDRELRPHRDVLGRLNSSSNMEYAFARGVAVDVLEGGIRREEMRSGRSDAIATRGPTYVDVTPPTSFELQLMVREELSRTNEDGTLMYPHLQKFMPPVPSRFVQTRESTQAAISDTYNAKISRPRQIGLKTCAM